MQSKNRALKLNDSCLMITAHKEFFIQLWHIRSLKHEDKGIVMLELHNIHNKCSNVLEIP
jgi:hypothetical protein